MGKKPRRTVPTAPEQPSLFRKPINIEWKALFPVQVKDAELSIAGDYFFQKGEAHFVPAFPFDEGLDYQVIFKGSLLDKTHKDFSQTLRLEKTPRLAPRVLKIYPDIEYIPENLLRFYIHFSTPMRDGEMLKHIQLHDENGNNLSGIFFDNQYELWNSAHTRLTLLLDPGRVKTSLKAHKKMGRAFVAGKRYRLLINPTWQNLRSQHLQTPFEKKLIAVEADLNAPDIQCRKIIPPEKQTKKPLSITFDKPMDHVQVEQFVSFANPLGQPVIGKMKFKEDQRKLNFIPETPWLPGDYTIYINSRLEDVAGNNINGLFDHPVGSLKSEQEGLIKKLIFSIKG